MRGHLNFHKEKGNVIWTVLIGVSLLAALSFAVTRAGRSGNVLDREQTVLAAQEVVQYTTEVAAVVKQLMRMHGCADTQINFNYDSDGDGNYVSDAGDLYNNTLSPTDMSCHVFHAAGGGMIRRPPPAGVNDGSDWYFAGQVNFVDVGTSADELAMFLPRVTEGVCEALNNGLGHDFSSIPGALDSFDNAPRFDGAYTGAPGEDMASLPGTDGRMSFCWEETDTGEYFYARVLVAR